MNKKNGKIELMRFAFAMMVLSFHCWKAFSGKAVGMISFFSKGYIAVEFFFLVSGYLMAKSLAKGGREDLSFSRNWGQFMWKKYKSVFAPHLFATAFIFVELCLINQWGVRKLLKTFLDGIPSIFFVQKLGFNYYNINNVEWYISAMLIAMALIYPFLKKWYSTYSGMVAPILAMMILGWLFHDYHTVSGASKWDLWGFRCVWRAIAEINLGIFAYRCTDKLSKENWNMRERVLLTVLEWMGWLFSVVIAVVNISTKYEIYAIIAIFLSVVIAFSRISCGNECFDRPLFFTLGRISLPLYLMHMTAVEGVNAYMGEQSLMVKYLVVLVLCVPLVGIDQLAGAWIGKKLDSSHLNRIIMKEEKYL